MRRIPPVSGWSVVVLVGLLVGGTVLLNAVAFADSRTHVGFSHQSATPTPDCAFAAGAGVDLATPEDDGPAADASTPRAMSSLAATPASLADLDLRIEATAGNGDGMEGGLPYALRLFTLRLPAAGEPVEGIGEEACRIGFFVLSVVAGEVEFTHHAAPDGSTSLGRAGAMTFSRSGEVAEQPLAVGASEVLRPGDAIFIEEAIFSFRSVGPNEVLLIGSSVTPEFLPCAGGGCS